MASDGIVRYSRAPDASPDSPAIRAWAEGEEKRALLDIARRYEIGSLILTDDQVAQLTGFIKEKTGSPQELDQ